MNKDDAKLTIEGQIIDALADTSLHTRLVAGPASEVLVAAIMKNLQKPGIADALVVLTQKDGPAT